MAWGNARNSHHPARNPANAIGADKCRAVKSRLLKLGINESVLAILRDMKKQSQCRYRIQVNIHLNAVTTSDWNRRCAFRLGHVRVVSRWIDHVQRPITGWR